ncbi:MAG: hypothetical protein EOP48_10325 [Sphingobacteriales bacterium]|nr:MAG: hypothetical protein EOP48_10325 [Sphingobacteriales bacterium]
MIKTFFNSSWASIVGNESFYVDKTKAIEQLESTGKYLKLFRPRRFGKSLFCNQLALYYDVLESGSKEVRFLSCFFHASIIGKIFLFYRDLRLCSKIPTSVRTLLPIKASS